MDAQALGPLRKAVYLDPTAGHAHFLLGGALSRLGQHGRRGRVLPRGGPRAAGSAADGARLLPGRALRAGPRRPLPASRPLRRRERGGRCHRRGKDSVVSGYVTFMMGGREMAGRLVEVREVVRAVGVEPLAGSRAPVTGLLDPARPPAAGRRPAHRGRPRMTRATCSSLGPTTRARSGSPSTRCSPCRAGRAAADATTARRSAALPPYVARGPADSAVAARCSRVVCERCVAASPRPPRRPA